MERKQALAMAATITCVLGTATIAAAAVGGTSILGFGGADGGSVRFESVAQHQEAGQATQVVRRTKNVYDKVVVGGTAAPSVRAKRFTPAAVPPAAGGFVVPSASAPSAPNAGGATGTGDDSHRRRTSSKPTTERKRPTRAPSRVTNEPEQETGPSPTTTTVAPVTTTTRPRGVPKDWPADKPIPPMPPNCHQPQLEDNGVWNCQDD